MSHWLLLLVGATVVKETTPAPVSCAAISVEAAGQVTVLEVRPHATVKMIDVCASPRAPPEYDNSVGLTVAFYNSVSVSAPYQIILMSS